MSPRSNSMGQCCECYFLRQMRMHSGISRFPVRRQTDHERVARVSFPLPSSNCFHLQPTSQKTITHRPFPIRSRREKRQQGCVCRREICLLSVNERHDIGGAGGGKFKRAVRRFAVVFCPSAAAARCDDEVECSEQREGGRGPSERASEPGLNDWPRRLFAHSRGMP